MMWNEYHANPVWSYYFFLRKVYAMPALKAWQYMKAMGLNHA